MGYINKDMPNQSLKFRILWYLETIVSARLLLFCIPVLMNKYIEKRFAAFNADDWFIIFLTIMALLYFMIGLASIIGYRSWKILHYLGAVLSFCMTGGGDENDVINQDTPCFCSLFTFKCICYHCDFCSIEIQIVEGSGCFPDPST